MILESETFFQLLTSPAHWAAEIVNNLLLDGFILGCCWPWIKRHWGHHKERDRRDGV